MFEQYDFFDDLFGDEIEDDNTCCCHIWQLKALLTSIYYKCEKCGKECDNIDLDICPICKGELIYRKQSGTLECLECDFIKNIDNR